ncbi:MAG: hypothetical protein FWF52_05490 [Candidatus Azobacteroides sp.]|nr:hypothetical protein [Candidatus Azobacteroides sp.]
MNMEKDCIKSIFMKKMFCIISIVLANGLSAYSQTKIKDVYEFPVKQENREWGEFETIEKRMAALQIPDTVITTISTEGLLETCLEFPYLTDIFFCDNYQQGFEALKAEFNGFRELFKRPNLTNVLLEKYRSLSVDVKEVRIQNDVKRGEFSFRYFVLEFMLTQDIIFKNLSLEQEKQLFLLSFEHKKIKQNYSDIFSNLNDLPTNLLYVKKAMNDPEFKFENAELKKTLSDFIQAPLSVDQRIIGNIENYINNKYK